MERKRASGKRGPSDYALQPLSPLEAAAKKDVKLTLPPALQTHCDFLTAKLGEPTFQMPFERAVVLCDLLKLAIRYPGLEMQAIAVGRILLDEMYAEFEKQSPGIGEWLRRGDQGQGKAVPHGK